MPVSVLQGDPFENVFVPLSAQIHLGSAAGQTFGIKNASWNSFATGQITLQTSATAGNRVWVFQFLDSAGNIIFENTPATVEPASSQFRYTFGGFEPNVFITPVELMPVSYPIFLPPNSSIKVFDQANIDATNDTINVFSMIFTT